MIPWRVILKPLLAAVALFSSLPVYSQQPLVFQGRGGPGKGKHIVFVVGDQEYRSEESMPRLARMMAERHGFQCTVLFPINRKTGQIDPSTTDNIPGLETLRKADLMVMFLRWLELPDDQTKEIIDYANSGRPIVALRTATHPFYYQTRKDSPYAKYSWRSKEFDGGFGRQVLGETWINHYGVHQKESTRALPAPGMEKHLILKGVKNVWGPSDVYQITTLTGDSKPVMLGQVLRGMEPTSPPNTDKKLTPVAWTKSYTGESGKTARIFTTTMGHAGDFKSEGFRRLVANACYWALGMEKKIKPNASVDFSGEYNPPSIGVNSYRRDIKASDFTR